MKLSFLGAAGTVTGSRYLLQHEGRRLLVDCGLFQGYKQLRLRNWAPFPFDASALEAVLLTHAHLDHSGALPLLARRGFHGPVFATPATAELCALLLPDSGHLQEEDAAYANRHHTSKHEPALPLYTEEEARATQHLLRPVSFMEWVDVAPGWRARWRRAGHILGAASIEIDVDGRRILFSGDLGRPDDSIMPPPQEIDSADVVVVESTYGDRRHDAGDPETLLGEVISRTAARGGIVLIPSFAVGRAQAMLYAVHRLKQRRAIPDLPVFLNSPMSIDMTQIYHRHRGEHRLSIEECAGMCGVARMVRTEEESRALGASSYPSVIVSASGMATGGRVLHHLKALAPQRRNTIVFPGFQAPGTRGARLLAGERRVRIFGEEVEVNAEVVPLPGYSAHADAPQLIDWLRSAPKAPRQVFVTHGEPGPADALRERIEHELGWAARVPEAGETVEL